MVFINIKWMAYLEYHPFHAVNPQTPQKDSQKTGVQETKHQISEEKLSLNWQDNKRNDIICPLLF